jgi:3-dehydroquinate synthase class II
MKLKEGDIVRVYRIDGRNKENIVGRLMEIRKTDRKEGKLKYPRFHIRILIGKGWHNHIYNAHYYALAKETGSTKKIWEKFEEDSIAFNVAKRL